MTHCDSWRAAVVASGDQLVIVNVEIKESLGFVRSVSHCDSWRSMSHYDSWRSVSQCG